VSKNAVFAFDVFTAMAKFFLPRYFKCLSSDFYKNKRGQIIFVHETMVKSKSKTVDLSKDEKKVDEFKHIQ